MKVPLLILTILFCSKLNANDTLILGHDQAIKEQLKYYEARIAQLEANGNNYQIEKDLLKETYSVNYERANLFLTTLGVLFAFLSFMGLRSINEVKKQYRDELDKLSELQRQAAAKADEFQGQKERFDKEIEQLTAENQEQEKRIQYVEALEKANLYLSKNSSQPLLALEYIDEALRYDPTRPEMLRMKAQCLNRLNRSAEALVVLLKAAEHDRSQSLVDLMETHMFLGQVGKASALLEENKELFDVLLGRNGGAFVVTAFRHYHEGNLEMLRKLAIDLAPRFDMEINVTRMTWGLVEALCVAFHYPESEKKDVLLNFLWWCDSQISGNELFRRIKK